VFGQPGFEHRSKHRRDGAHSAWPARDAIGSHWNSIHPLELGRDLLAQRDHALRVGVESLVLVDRAFARVADVLRGWEVGLPDVEADRSRGAQRLVGDLANP
jgi:hypothetical protein